MNSEIDKYFNLGYYAFPTNIKYKDGKKVVFPTKNWVKSNIKHDNNVYIYKHYYQT